MNSCGNGHSVVSFADTPYNPNTSKLIKAIELKNFEAVKEFIAKDETCTNSYGGSFRETALHKAAQQGWTECVKFLLKNGAKVDSKNFYDQNPLHYACAAAKHDSVKLLIAADSGSALHQKDKRGHTPLHDASEVGCVKCVSEMLEKGADINAQDNNMERPLHKAAKDSSVDVLLLLLNAGADLGAKNKSGDSVLRYILRHSPITMELILDNCVVPQWTRVNAKKKLEIHFIFRPIVGGSSKNQVKILRDIVDIGYPQLLQHPICEAFLHLKWINVRNYFYGEVFFYFLYSMLSSLLLMNKFVMMTHHTHLSGIPASWCAAFKVTIAIQSVCIILKEILVMCQGLKAWFYSVWHIMNLLISITVPLVILFCNPNYWQHHLATITILFIWVQCMLHISRFPNCGIYVSMFTKVAKVFLRIFSIFFCLLLAFSLSFYISRYGNQYDHDYNYTHHEKGKDSSKHSSNSSSNSHVIFPNINLNFTTTTTTTESSTSGLLLVDDDVYENPILTFFKTVTMMIGELDFDNSFVKQLAYVPYTSHIIYIVFVLLVSIILSNLIVALAVNDVQGLRKMANVERLIKQMEVVIQMESTFLTLGSMTFFPDISSFRFNRKKNLLQDIAKVRVTMEPYTSSMERKILVTDKDYKEIKHVRVKKEFVDNLMKRINTNEESNTNKFLCSKNIRRLSMQQSSQVLSLTKTDETQEGFQNIENILSDITDGVEGMKSSIKDLSRRLDAFDDVKLTFKEMSGRLKMLEDLLYQIHSRFEQNPIMLNENLQILCHSNNMTNLVENISVPIQSTNNLSQTEALQSVSSVSKEKKVNFIDV